MKCLNPQLKSAKTVGLEFPDAGAFLKDFSDALPQAKLVDVADAAMHIRRIKSPEEIEIIRQGSRIAELGAYAAINTIHEGVPEYEVTLSATNTMVREIAKAYPHVDIRDGELFISFTPLFLISQVRGSPTPVTGKKCNNREFKHHQRLRQRQRQPKSNRFRLAELSSVRASRIFVHFYYRTTTTKNEMKLPNSLRT